MISLYIRWYLKDEARSANFDVSFIRSASETKVWSYLGRESTFREPSG